MNQKSNRFPLTWFDDGVIENRSWAKKYVVKKRTELKGEVNTELLENSPGRRGDLRQFLLTINDDDARFLIKGLYNAWRSRLGKMQEGKRAALKSSTQLTLTKKTHRRFRKLVKQTTNVKKTNDQTLNNLIDFFEQQKGDLKRKLDEDLQKTGKRKEFEANTLRRQLESQSKKIARLKENYEAALVLLSRYDAALRNIDLLEALAEELEVQHDSKNILREIIESESEGTIPSVVKAELLLVERLKRVAVRPDEAE